MLTKLTVQWGGSVETHIYKGTVGGIYPLRCEHDGSIESFTAAYGAAFSETIRDIQARVNDCLSPPHAIAAEDISVDWVQIVRQQDFP